MNFNIITTPNQINLINDLIFDVTGIPISANEIIITAVALISIKMIFNSPLFAND